MPVRMGAATHEMKMFFVSSQLTDCIPLAADWGKGDERKRARGEHNGRSAIIFQMQQKSTYSESDNASNHSMRSWNWHAHVCGNHHHEACRYETSEHSQHDFVRHIFVVRSVEYLTSHGGCYGGTEEYHSTKFKDGCNGDGLWKGDWFGCYGCCLQMNYAWMLEREKREVTMNV